MEDFKIDLGQNEENAVCYEVYTEAAGTGTCDCCNLSFRMWDEYVPTTRRLCRSEMPVYRRPHVVFAL